MPFAASSNGTRRPTQSVTPTKCAVSSWARCSTPSGPGTARLIVSPLASASRRRLGCASSTSACDAVAARVAEEDRARPEPSAVAEPLHETLALEGADEPRGRALRQAGAGRELADRRRLRAPRRRARAAAPRARSPGCRSRRPCAHIVEHRSTSVKAATIRGSGCEASRSCPSGPSSGPPATSDGHVPVLRTCPVPGAEPPGTRPPVQAGAATPRATPRAASRRRRRGAPRPLRGRRRRASPCRTDRRRRASRRRSRPPRAPARR